MLGSPYYTGGMFKTTNNTEGFIFLPQMNKGAHLRAGDGERKKTEARSLSLSPPPSLPLSLPFSFPLLIQSKPWVFVVMYIEEEAAMAPINLLTLLSST
jgi:hypothetical protein